MYQKIKLLIVGGCFPVQDNIESNKLYHQILKNRLQESHNINLDIKIIRYESISSCLEKIKEAVNIELPDWLLFHLRAEPILLPSKLYSKYHDKDHSLIKRIKLTVLNFDYKKKGNANTKKIIDKELISKSTFNLKIQYFFRELNYFFGYLTGNWSDNMIKYFTLLTNIISICKTQGILLIITGPVSRPFSFFENQLSIKLNQYIVRRLSHHNMIYLNLLGTRNGQDNFLFCSDLKRVNEIGHERISNIILNTLLKAKLNFKNITSKNILT